MVDHAPTAPAVGARRDAGRRTAAASDRPKAGLAALEGAGVLLELALQADGVVWDRRFGTVDQGRDRPDELLAIDRTARDLVVDVDDVVDRASHGIGRDRIGVIAVHPLFDRLEVLVVAEGVDAPKGGTRA